MKEIANKSFNDLTYKEVRGLKLPTRVYNAICWSDNDLLEKPFKYFTRQDFEKMLKIKSLGATSLKHFHTALTKMDIDIEPLEAFNPRRKMTVVIYQDWFADFLNWKEEMEDNEPA